MLIRLGVDHPRGCGEHPTSIPSAPNMLGSSPRMRGAQFVGDPSIHVQRIIPADAGSTTAYPKNIADKRDHPRGCGEHLFRFFSTL